MEELVEDNGETHPPEVYLQRISRDIRELVHLNREMVRYMREAEDEVPEKVRRFMNYFHDVHDCIYAYEERGILPPAYFMREMERLHDRYRQILEAQHQVGGSFEKVRTEMAKDERNRYDHTPKLS